MRSVRAHFFWNEVTNEHFSTSAVLNMASVSELLLLTGAACVLVCVLVCVDEGKGSGVGRVLRIGIVVLHHHHQTLTHTLITKVKHR